MDEADALCDNIAIMVNGKMQYVLLECLSFFEIVTQYSVVENLILTYTTYKVPKKHFLKIY